MTSAAGIDINEGGRWISTLSEEEREFLISWLPICDKHGAGAEAFMKIRPKTPQRRATQHATRWLAKLHSRRDAWIREGKSDPFPPLTKDWLLGQLDDISQIHDIADNSLGQSLMLRQKLDPVDVRTYRDFVVDYLKPRLWQVYMDPARYRVVVAGRRSGKTHEAVTEILTNASIPGSNCYYLGKTRKNTKKAPWKIFKKLLNWEYVEKISENEGFVRLTNGSEVQFDGVEEPDNLRGDGLTFLVLEEFASWKHGKKIWDQVLRPMLSDRKGRALFIGTPAGYNHFRSMYVLGVNSDESQWSAHQFSTLEAGLIDAEEIEDAKRTMDPRSFRQEFEASFEQLSSRVFDYFDRQHHEAEEVAGAGDHLLVGIDFNLDPMTAVIAQKDENGDCEVLEALELNYSNTDELLDEVEKRYPETTFTAYPDPSGHKRHTAAGGKTDFSLIEDRPRWKIDQGMRRQIPLSDKINNVQANLQDAAGGHHVTIHRKKGTCLIEALEGLTYIEGTSQPEKTGYDHITDAFGYLLWGAFNRFRKKMKLGTFAT